MIARYSADYIRTEFIDTLCDFSDDEEPNQSQLSDQEVSSSSDEYDDDAFDDRDEEELSSVNRFVRSETLTLLSPTSQQTSSTPTPSSSGSIPPFQSIFYLYVYIFYICILISYIYIYIYTFTEILFVQRGILWEKTAQSGRKKLVTLLQLNIQ